MESVMELNCTFLPFDSVALAMNVFWAFFPCGNKKLHMLWRMFSNHLKPASQSGTTYRQAFESGETVRKIHIVFRPKYSVKLI